MAYLDATNLHALPTQFATSPLEPASILFPKGPLWTRRYQRNPTSNHPNNQFVYTDQGPPMYRLLGSHNIMLKIPQKTDLHATAHSYHFELRQNRSPSYSNDTLTFPAGPPPPQIAVYNSKVTTPVSSDQQIATQEMPSGSVQSVKVWDKYRYMHGPPSETHVYRTRCEGMTYSA